MENKIIEAIQIKSNKWEDLKQRYYLTYNVIETKLKKDKKAGGSNVIKSAIGNFNDMFKDKEKDLNKLFKKYNTNTSWWKADNNEIVQKSILMAYSKSNVDFIQDLLKPQ